MWPLIAAIRFPAAKIMASSGVAVGFEIYLCLWKRVADTRVVRVFIIKIFHAWQCLKMCQGRIPFYSVRQRSFCRWDCRASETPCQQVRMAWRCSHVAHTPQKVIIAENVKFFHQNKGACPLLDGPQLYSDIRDFGSVTQVESILDSMCICPDNTYLAVKTFLRHLKLPTTVSDKEPPTLMGLAAQREAWKIFKETTFSQGPHIGMYETAAQHPLLGCIFHQKSEIPYLSQYSIQRHSTDTEIMLPKQIDQWSVKDLCTIFLLDSEANHTYKYILVDKK